MDVVIASLFPNIKSAVHGQEFSQYSYIGYGQSIVLRFADESTTCTIRISNMVCTRYFNREFDIYDLQETYDIVKNFDSYFDNFETVETFANIKGEPYIYKIFEREHVEVRFVSFTILFTHDKVIFTPDIQTILS